MNTNTGSTHRLHGLPGPVAAAAAFAANAWAAVPASRGSPPYSHQPASGPRASRPPAGPGQYAGAGEGRAS
jgi:hypothetical protein